MTLYRKVFINCLILIFLSTLSHASEKRFVVPIGDSPVMGPKDAPIKMIKFIDYQ